MSNEKADRVAYKFYAKLTFVVNHARATVQPPPQAGVDKWFNLEIPECDLFKEQTRLYRSLSSMRTVPPFRIQVLLAVPELANNQVLVYLAPDSSRLRIDPTPRYILLESWDMLFAPTRSQNRYGDDRADVALPTMYKQAIPLFRSMYTLLRILPAWKLSRRIRSRTGGNRNGNFSILLRVQDSDEHGATEGTLGFNTPPAPNAPPLDKDSHEFTPVTHPMGTLSLSVTHLTAPHFQLDELESLLSSRFLSLDEGPDFTPTLVKNQQRDSLSGSPGSLPVRTSLPRSPPSSVADRFVVPPAVHSRTTSLSGLSGLGGGSPRAPNVGLPPSRRQSTVGVGAVSPSGTSDASSSRQGAASREEFPASALAARLRKESTGAGRGIDFTPSPGPVPIRRPINQVNPFKSSTLSSGSPSLHSPSPSLRQHSPLSSGGPSLPSRPAHTSPSSSRAHIPQAITRAPPSPIPPFRPSPPYAPSSLGDRRSLASVEGVTVEGSPRLTGKRYSSSFGHRYAATGGVDSEGSAGSGAKEGERVASPSFLSTNTDDDDISAFVQDIDARKPLGGLRDQSTASSPAGSVHGRGTPEPHPPPLPSTLQRARTLSVHEPMLTTAGAVDERLREMNEAFMASLEGLGGRRRKRGDSVRARAGSAQPVRPPLNPSGVDTARVPPGYVRPRFPSTGSARSAMSVASGEVLGRMDPEVEDDAQRGLR